MIRQTLILFSLLTLITSVFYPVFLYGIGYLFFKDKIHGSLIYENNRCIGAKNIGQSFSQNHYFWGRPNTGIYGSPCAPLHTLEGQIALEKNIQTLQAKDPNNTLPIPIDLVTHSASGIDPHISMASALYQVSRIAQARNLPEITLKNLLLDHTETPKLGFIAYGYVNVLTLNHALDQLSQNGQ